MLLHHLFVICSLSYLVVSDEDGIVNIYVYGVLSIAHINLHNYSAQVGILVQY